MPLLARELPHREARRQYCTKRVIPLAIRPRERDHSGVFGAGRGRDASQDEQFA